MNKNYLYNFRNPIRHFINIENLNFPTDIETFDTTELSWTMPISFRIHKNKSAYRTLKFPNILNFIRSYHYYKSLPFFDSIYDLNPSHKRLKVNLETGDFVAGEYNKQLDNDFVNLCLYDILIKLDISEFYGRIYTHYLDLNTYDLKDNVLSGLNNGRTSGLIMGNYLSLYFAEYLLAKISVDIQNQLENANIDCSFNHFSDDFFFFCNQHDYDKIIKIFDDTLEKFDFTRKKEVIIYDYEHYNTHNILTRYWKSILRHWNEDIIKDMKNSEMHSTTLNHRLIFLNQLIYRISMLSNDRNKQLLINNFFKTKAFQEIDSTVYNVNAYDYHQLCFLLKKSPESLLYTSKIFDDFADFDNLKIKNFLLARYKIALTKQLHDEQLYFYYALKCYHLDDTLNEYEESVLYSKNQILISYYLKDGFFSDTSISILKEQTDELLWFQNYHLILYSDLIENVSHNIEQYLIPSAASSKPVKLNRYKNFYFDNLVASNSLLNDIDDVSEDIDNYLALRSIESGVYFHNNTSLSEE